jgi:hypothetical protein
MRALPAACLLAACASAPPSSPHVESARSTIVVTHIEAPAAPVAPPTPAVVVSFTRTAPLYAAPNKDAARIGVIKKDTRVVVEEAIDGADCRWIRIAPRGWTCDRVVEPTDQPATTADESDGDDPHPISGTYGYVRGGAEAFASVADARAGENGRTLDGSNTVRATSVVTIAGRTYWVTSQGELIDAEHIGRIAPSTFRGVAIDDSAHMPAWVRARWDPYKPAKVYAEPSSRARAVGELAPRTVVEIVERSDDARFARIARRALCPAWWCGYRDDEWIARADLRAAALAAPPAGIGDAEKWFDIDRDEQVLVAYEGARPVFATLVSTGKWEHETPTEIARVASKLETAMMTSDKESIYSVADVPWTMYYDRNFALHTSYWHDGFGGPRSHGCVNLSPRDARFLYRWSSPDVPPGWIAVYGDASTPGSIVRVRSRRDPEPAYRGYARELLASR